MLPAQMLLLLASAPALALLVPAARPVSPMQAQQSTMSYGARAACGMNGRFAISPFCSELRRLRMMDEEPETAAAATPAAPAPNMNATSSDISASAVDFTPSTAPLPTEEGFDLSK
mmetsp:Transcript_19874/g.42924  ORF Transcript_19874/g.42924 Transcript_19874/m.42924 type:complete len:116 (-) Transcript_19874:1320-1667(-)